MNNRSRLNKKSQRKPKATTQRARLRGRDIKKKWKVRLIRSTANGPVSVEYRFPTRDGGKGSLRVQLSELRHPKRLLDFFCNHMPIFPNDVGASDNSQIDFLKEQVARRKGAAEVIPDQPGFIDKKSFATWTHVIHSDGRQTPIRRDAISAHQHGDLKGTLEGSTENVLRLAEYSSFLAFSIGVALAAPLATYLRLNRANDDEQGLVVTETAVFNYSGKSSSGKTSCGLSAISLVGAPDRIGTMNFSERGFAEHVAGSNNIVAVADDTENSTDLAKSLRILTHQVPAGRSKQISKGVDQAAFPELRYSTFVLCSSPAPIPILATQLGWEMSQGDKVRLFDINVPPPEKGGIFDRVPGRPKERAKRSIELIGQLEDGYLNHYGHVFPKWIEHLLSANLAPTIIKAANQFVRYVDADRNGWQKRFAQKFGLVYAAMVLGVKLGLLPWSKELPLQVAIKCYRRALKGAMTEAEINRYFAAKLCATIKRPKRLIDVKKDVTPSGPIQLSRRCVALRYSKAERTKIGVFDDVLMNHLKTKKAKSKFTAALVQARVLGKGHGHAGTVQIHAPIVREGEVILKPHVWEMDYTRLHKFIYLSE